MTHRLMIPILAVAMLGIAGCTLPDGMVADRGYAPEGIYTNSTSRPSVRQVSPDDDGCWWLQIDIGYGGSATGCVRKDVWDRHPVGSIYGQM